MSLTFWDGTIDTIHNLITGQEIKQDQRFDGMFFGQGSAMRPSVAAHTVEVWLWTFVYLWVGAFDTVEKAVDFTLVTYTMLGFGDITLSIEHRLLSGFTAVNGLILVGLTTAFFIEIYRSLDARKRQHRSRVLI